MVSLAILKVHEVPFIVVFSACAIGALFRKLSPVSMCLGLFPTLSGLVYCVEDFDPLGVLCTVINMDVFSFFAVLHLGLQFEFIDQPVRF